jgi:hypothetical protein
MKIDIDQLNESAFREPIGRIVQRPRFLQQMRAHAGMPEFSPGERMFPDPSAMLV